MKIKYVILSISMMLGVGVFFTPPVFAAGAGCGVLDFNGVSCEQADNDATGKDNIKNFLVGILRILTAAVGIVAVGALVFAGILYSMASGDPQKTSQAKTMITNTVIGILAYAAMGIILNFLVPGGIL